MNKMSRSAARRRLSRRSMLSGLGVAAASVATAGVARAACSVTAYQIDGPFFPYTTGEQDWDMTHIAGGADRAAGEVIEVAGKIQDANCRPVGDCVLEIWQANVHGRYDHPKDANPAPLDPNFQGYARIVTDKDGSYRFRTIRPAPYAAIGDWYRPAHIHFKVHPPLNPGVTTQMYFHDDPLLESDLLLKPLSESERAGLIVAFDTETADGIKQGTFNLQVPEGWMPPPELMDIIRQQQG